MQGGKRPTKAQQDWQNWQRQQGCANCGAPNPSIHHAVGSTAKHNKVHIGQDFTIPLCDTPCHKVPFGIHGDMSALNTDLGRKDYEKLIFDSLFIDFCAHHEYEPMPFEVYDAIMDYHK